MKCMLCGTDNREEAQRCKGCAAVLSKNGSVPPRARPTPTLLDNIAKPSSDNRQIGSSTRVVSIEDQSLTENNPQDSSKKTRYVLPQEGDDKNNMNPRLVPSKAPIAGFLVSFTWDSSGVWCLIREGRNIYGADPDCDGQLKSDPAVSGKHFTIMCRNGKIRIKDMESTNATIVDGKEIWSNTVEAGHGSSVKVGDTTLTVVLIPRQEKQQKQQIDSDSESRE